MVDTLKIIIIITTLCFNTLYSQTKPDAFNRLNAKNKKEGFWKVYLTDYLIETKDSTQAYYFAYDYYINGHLIIWTSSAQYYKKKAIEVTTDNHSNKGQPVLLSGHFKFYYSYGLGLWRANCVKKIYYFYHTLLQCDSWLFQTATGFACQTLGTILPTYPMDKSSHRLTPKDLTKLIGLPVAISFFKKSWTSST